jgi:thiol-disulfide isomerase/thioredoxin
MDVTTFIICVAVALLFMTTAAYAGGSGSDKGAMVEAHPNVIVGEGPARQLTADNITNNLQYWEADLAIMFYAPWCQYCKQLSPSMDSIAELLAGSKELTVGKYNCEDSVESINLCTTLGVTKYPTVKFIGYGNFNQASPTAGVFATIFYRSPTPRMVEFVADMYPDAIYDWIRVLSNVSWLQRKADNLWRLLVGTSRAESQVAKLKHELAKLQEKEKHYNIELEKQRTIELFERLQDRGDPFPLLHALEPDKVGVDVHL